MDPLYHLRDTFAAADRIRAAGQPVEFCDLCERVIGPSVDGERCPTCGHPRRCVLASDKVADGVAHDLGVRLT